MWKSISTIIAGIALAWVMFGCADTGGVAPTVPTNKTEHTLTYGGRGSTFEVRLPGEVGTIDRPPTVQLLVRCSTDKGWTVHVSIPPGGVHIVQTVPGHPASPLTIKGAHSLMFAAANWLLIVTYFTHHDEDSY